MGGCRLVREYRHISCRTETCCCESAYELETLDLGGQTEDAYLFNACCAPGGCVGWDYWTYEGT